MLQSSFLMFKGDNKDVSVMGKPDLFPLFNHTAFMNDN